MYTWGLNGKAQLGMPTGPGAGVQIPRRMELLVGWDIRCAAPGAAAQQRRRLPWGYRQPAPPRRRRRRTELRRALRFRRRAISCGAEHTIAITPQDVITWGSNEHGQCGHGEKAETDWVKPRSIKVGAGPRRREKEAPEKRERLGSRREERQRLAAGRSPPPALPPSLQMLHEQMVTQVVCGRFHTLCVTATSQVFAWGLNSSGQLGLGDTLDRRAPAAVDALWAMPVLQLAAGEGGGRTRPLGAGFSCSAALQRGCSIAAGVAARLRGPA